MPSTLIFVSLFAMGAPPEAFQVQVRTTDPQAAHEQQATFHLPPGFEIQLFAAEPDIQKPMNLAFDARGRVWVSGSVEYPYAAKDRPGRDTIKVLEDTDGDGRADKITTFADGLNIPIGLYPYKNGVIAYSIPNIYYLQDTNGDDRADRRDVLYGPLGEARDTHGMHNAFRRGFDGWLYINHGFANTSTIAGSDGSSITLNSGNTYRVRVDGSGVEQFTWGQVNPFGSAWTETGDLITTDCHSKPLTLLIRDGYYSSFGKPHDGLGFAPELMQHHHGSTGLAGAAYSGRAAFPAEFQNSLFLGNVVTSRVHRDTVDYRGSSPSAIEQADFITTDDPWFRPVDLRMGPDGALYIADFYNRVIGHYEVPLDHPGRDRHRARIWRVVYTGATAQSRPARRSLNQARAAELIQALGEPNLTLRMLAMDQLTDRIGVAAQEPLRAAMRASRNPAQRIHAAWTLFRLEALTEEELLSLMREDESRVRIHGFKILAESTMSSSAQRQCLIDGLANSNPRLQRAAAEAAGQRIDLPVMRHLLEQLVRADDRDVFLRHSLRIALRNQLRSDDNFDALVELSLSPRQRAAMIEIALAIPSTYSAKFVLDHMQQGGGTMTAERLSYVARYLPIERCDEVVDLIQARAAADLSLQAKLFGSLQTALMQRGAKTSPVVRAWGQQLASSLLLAKDDDPAAWRSIGADNPWGLEARTTSAGQRRSFLSSLPGGEQKTGTLQSAAFPLPARLAFELCGHRGSPADQASDDNQIRLVLLDDGQVIRRAFPPRRDQARRVVWDLTEYQGRQAIFEIVDGLDLSAYAWLAVADIEPSVIEIPRVPPLEQAERQIVAAEIAEQWKLATMEAELRKLVAAGNPWRVRAAAAKALLAIHDCTARSYLIPLITEESVEPAIRERVCRALVGEEPIDAFARDLFRLLPVRHQLVLAQQMATGKDKAALLVSMIDSGQASRQLLQNATVQERMAAIVDAPTKARIAELMSGLPPANQQLEKVLAEQLAELARASASRLRGQGVFKQQCAICHQVGGEGTLVGPQLDGIGNRGRERLVEDVLAPHRNVDAAFQTSILTLHDGRVVSGLFRRNEGQTIVLVDNQGKEFTVATEHVDEHRRARTSIMPENFAETLNLQSRNDLFAYLVSLQKK